MSSTPIPDARIPATTTSRSPATHAREGRSTRITADLVAFDRNPLDDVWVVRDPMFVMSDGHLIHHRTVTAEGHIAPRVEWTGYGTGGPRP